MFIKLSGDPIFVKNNQAQTMVDEQVIWERFRQGDRSASSYIYNCYVRFLFNYGKKFTLDEDLIKDAIQELFFDLIRTHERLGHTDNIRFYLMRAFRRRISLEIKQRSMFTSPDEQLPEQPVSSHEEDWINREAHRSQSNRVKKAIDELSPKQREILFYRFNCGFEYEEICELLSIKYDTARKMVYRAIKSLREHLSDSPR